MESILFRNDFDAFALGLGAIKIKELLTKFFLLFKSIMNEMAAPRIDTIGFYAVKN